MKYTEKEYIDEPVFQDESELSCITVKIKTARKRHLCYGISGQQEHYIEPGEKYRHEKALVDATFWGEYKMCLSCMDKIIDRDY